MVSGCARAWRGGGKPGAMVRSAEGLCLSCVYRNTRSCPETARAWSADALAHGGEEGSLEPWFEARRVYAFRAFTGILDRVLKRRGHGQRMRSRMAGRREAWSHGSKRGGSMPFVRLPEYSIES